MSWWSGLSFLLTALFVFLWLRERSRGSNRATAERHESSAPNTAPDAAIESAVSEASGSAATSTSTRPQPVTLQKEPSAATSGRAVANLDASTPLSEQLSAIDASVGEAFDRVSNPHELDQSEEFCAARDRMLQPDVNAEQLFELYSGTRGPLAWPAVKALGLRSDGAAYVVRIIETMGSLHPWTRFFALQAIHAHTPNDQALAPRVLLSLDSSWNADANAPPLGSFLTWRARGGERLSFGESLDSQTQKRLEELDEILGRLTPSVVAPLREELARAKTRVVDIEFLEEFGRVRRDSGGAERLIEHPALERQRTQLLEILRSSPVRSVLVVGESGVGKSSLIRSVAATLVADEWLVFEAAPEELNAEQKFIGELEGRITRLIREWKADIVIAHRPNDYHPDHRYTGVLVQDAAYMVTVPGFCPDTPHLSQNPVFLYFPDSFTKPQPFKPDVVVPIDRVMDQKLDALGLMESQFLEGGANGSADLRPSDPEQLEKRRREVRENMAQRNRRLAARFRAELRQQFPAAQADAVQFAEAFELCEYGNTPSAEQLRKMFPLPLEGR